MGGIGIFSVMQISISERTYEIGLRKSIGAADPEIFGQFLIESVSLSLVGTCSGRGSATGSRCSPGRPSRTPSKVWDAIQLLEAVIPHIYGRKQRSGRACSWPRPTSPALLRKFFGKG